MVFIIFILDGWGQRGAGAEGCGVGAEEGPLRGGAGLALGEDGMEREREKRSLSVLLVFVSAFSAVI